MTATLYVIPAEGLRIVDPAASDAERFLPPEGREVEDCDYWRRRLADRDVTLGAPPSPAQARA